MPFNHDNYFGHIDLLNDEKAEHPMGKRTERRLNEFTASLLSYVRPDHITGDVIDVRDAEARKWSALLVHNPTPAFLPLFATPENCHDCAAIFSGCVGVKNPGAVLRMEQAEPSQLASVISALKRTDRLPLTARKHHPAEAFLGTLLRTDVGRELYRSIAILLLHARSVPEFQSLLFLPSERDREILPVTLTIDAVNDPVDTDTLMDDGDPEEDISEENCAATVRRLASPEAGSVLRDAEQGDAHTFHAIMENQGAALAALQQDDAALGLSTRSAAKALEEILGTFTSPSEVRAMMDAYITPDRQAQLVAALGDLDSIAAITVGQTTLHLMLLHALANPTTIATPNIGKQTDPRERIDHSASRQNIQLYRIAMVIKHNPCYEQLLNVDLDGLSFRDRLLVAAWVLAGRLKFVDDITPDFFDNVGLDRDIDGGSRLQIFLDDRRADLDIDPDNLTDQIAQIRTANSTTSAL